jgi:nucleoid-associated protein YgaU
VWRSLVAVVGMTVASIGAAAPAPSPEVHLEIEARTGTADSVLVFSSATLDCDDGSSASGFLRNAARTACAAAQRGAVTKVAERQRRPRICAEAYAGPQLARLTGTVGGRRVNLMVSQADGCGSADWQTLRPILGDPERLGRVRARPKRTAPPTTAPPVVYQVQRGDTLTEIARHFHTTVGQITEANQLTDPDNLAEGQRLTIPPVSSLGLQVALLDGSLSGFQLTLRGGQPGEPVVFEIGAPDGSTYTGSPHLTGADGVVTTTYDTEIASGTYRVVASGDGGTEAETSFHVDPGH